MTAVSSTRVFHQLDGGAGCTADDELKEEDVVALDSNHFETGGSYSLKLGSGWWLGGAV